MGANRVEKIPTVKLARRDLIVLAHKHEPRPRAYANVKQAQTVCSRLGPGWYVTITRPFYVVRSTDEHERCHPDCPGWGHFDEGTDREGIQRCDECAIFPDDDAAKLAHDVVCDCGMGVHHGC